MRISSVEVIPYALPFREPYVTARGTLARREMALLRLRDEEGRVGLGEAVPLSLRGGATLADIVGELERLANRESIDEASLARAPISAPARCAALTALADLRGRLASSGAREAGAPEPIRCNATLVSGDPAAVAADAERWAGEGFTTFKLKLGAGDDVGQVRAVREALGAEARIRIDANGAWDVDTARRTLSEVEPFDVELAEQPVATVEELVEVADTTSIPISADESVETREDAERAMRAGACRLSGVKLSKVGGPEAAIEIAEVMTCYVSSALDGPVGIAAGAQVAQTLQAGDEAASLAHGLATQRLFASTIASVECELSDGVIHPPPGPGLGVEIDEAALDAHRL
jgi:o-succinylbenzoate synthase